MGYEDLCTVSCLAFGLFSLKALEALEGGVKRIPIFTCVLCVRARTLSMGLTPSSFIGH